MLPMLECLESLVILWRLCSEEGESGVSMQKCHGGSSRKRKFSRDQVSEHSLSSLIIFIMRCSAKDAGG